MSRKQLYDEAKALGLPVQWNTSTIVTLTDALRVNRRESLSLGADASFEEQFDHLAKGRRLDVFIRASREVGIYAFETRVEMGLAYLRCLDTPITIESLREAAVLLVGDSYSRSHPLNPHDSVERLRKAKLAVLKGGNTLDGYLYRSELMSYFAHWEMALTHDELALYLG
jgi:hypothetical protein